jgi:hypothetical protein
MTQGKSDKFNPINFITDKANIKVNSMKKTYDLYFPVENTKQHQSDCNDRLTPVQSD